MKAPVHSYPVTSSDCPYRILSGEGSLVEKNGRAGLHFRSIHGRAVLKNHTLAHPAGSVVVWVLPMQEMFPSAPRAEHALSNKFFDRFMILSDREAIQEIEAAGFSWFITSLWHPVFMAKFGPGTIGASLGGTAGPQRMAFAASGHFEMPRHIWQQLALTWNHATGDYALWCNGIKVGSHDTSQEKGTVFPCGANLFLGHPGFATGSAEFYDVALGGKVLLRKFEEESTDRDEPWQKHLTRIYTGEGLRMLSALPLAGRDGWSEETSFRLDAEDLASEFFVQGSASCYSNTSEGLRVSTPGLEERDRLAGFIKSGDDKELDLTRTYLWTRHPFEGDLCVSLEFKIHAHGGLFLLMTQAAGIQGEDFLRDYPLRSDGSMRCVCWEDIRNYHWEFYREIVDVRNDLVSHVCLKNPWHRPVAFQIESRTWELDQWYSLTWLQIGDRLQGAIDGKIVVDFLDNGYQNNGPVLRHGRVALRAMMRTDLTLRNLRILQRPDVCRTQVPDLP